MSSNPPRQSQWLIVIQFSIKSGYSRFPIHEPGKPLAFIGTLLVKKVRCEGCDRVTNTSSIFPSSLLNTILAKLFPYHLSPYLFCQKPVRLSTVSRPWTTCECQSRTRSSPLFLKNDFSQTGRAHLLLISETPGIAGGAIGIITLEDIIEVNRAIMPS